jgi:hypothetical protein
VRPPWTSQRSSGSANAGPSTLPATPSFPWRFPYQRDAPRQCEVLRPVVPVRLSGPDTGTPVSALVDSGSEHILAAPWLASDVAVDLTARRAPWPVLLGQHGFFDRFSVSMHRSAALTVVEDWGAFDDRFGVQPREADQHRSRFET